MLHNKDNKYGTNYLALAVCEMYNVHKKDVLGQQNASTTASMQIRKGQRGVSEGGREGAGIRPRVTDMVMVLYIQRPLYCPTAEQITTICRERRKRGNGSTRHREELKCNKKIAKLKCMTKTYCILCGHDLNPPIINTKKCLLVGMQTAKIISFYSMYTECFCVCIIIG